MLDVFASLLFPTSVFIRDDFPTFDLPMNANSGQLILGHSDALELLFIKLYLVIFFIYRLFSINHL